MNKDIVEMIGLQRLWGKKVKLELEIHHHEKSIAFWENKLKDLRNEISLLKEQLKKNEIDIRMNEKKIYELEEKHSKLQKRRDVIKTEKELVALEKEIQTIVTEKDELETRTIETMETTTQLQSKCFEMEKELERVEPQIKNDISYIQNKIHGCTESLAEIITQFNEKIKALSPEVKMRFERIIKSKDGIAIVPVEGNACSACHTVIPLDIIAQLSHNEKAINCTNCGRFLYRKSDL
ncbi:MAG: hypothetical protein N2316_04055 [Spirochaetes bacterium]|nr:hypothetical protein [Spirochaetota bacterium]